MLPHKMFITLYLWKFTIFDLADTRKKRSLWGLSGWGGIWKVFEGEYLRWQVFWGWENVPRGPIGHSGTVSRGSFGGQGHRSQGWVGAGLRKERRILESDWEGYFWKQGMHFHFWWCMNTSKKRILDSEVIGDKATRRKGGSSLQPRPSMSKKLALEILLGILKESTNGNSVGNFKIASLKIY